MKKIVFLWLTMTMFLFAQPANRTLVWVLPPQPVSYVAVSQSSDLIKWNLVGNYPTNVTSIVLKPKETKFFYKAIGIGSTPTAPFATFAWDKPQDSSITSYIVYWGITPNAYNQFLNAGTNLSLTVPNLNVNTRYYFAAASYNAAGMQSDFTPELNYLTGQATPPTNYNLKVTIK